MGSSILGPAWNQLTAHAALAGALAVVANPHGTMVAPLAQGTHMMAIQLRVVWACQAHTTNKGLVKPLMGNASDWGE
jgi:hypothetical protein